MAFKVDDIITPIEDHHKKGQLTFGKVYSVLEAFSKESGERLVRVRDDRNQVEGYFVERFVRAGPHHHEIAVQEYEEAIAAQEIWERV